MTPEERRILSPLASCLRVEYPEDWASLKYETHYGPEVVEFPYYPAAVEFLQVAQEAVAELGDSDKGRLVAEWRSRPRDPYKFNDNERILKQYGIVLVNLIVNRAKRAGSRTNEFY